MTEPSCMFWREFEGDPVTPPPPRLRIVLGETRMLSGFHLSPDLDDFRRIVRLHGDRNPGENIRELIRRTHARARDLITPLAVYTLLGRNRIPAAWFPEADMIALAVVTIGPALENEASRLSHSGDTTEALFMDAWGSALAEGAVNTIDRIVSAECRILGATRDRRRSPGYHPWPLTEQTRVFDILSPGRLGVSLSTSCMMTPRKSVSFGVPLTSQGAASG